ncbi:MAG: hypothetical protein OHK0015_55130 [Chloroflexi bacterium OHK40]
MDIADLQLILRRQPGGLFHTTAEFTAPGSVAPAILGETIPVAFDYQALLEQALDPNSYGLRLGSMLFADERLRGALAQARAASTAHRATLRIRIALDPGDPAIHALSWEGLRDPSDGAPLAVGDRFAMARVLPSADPHPLRPAFASDVRAVVVVASPRDLSAYGLAPLHIEAELSRACGALAGLRPETLARTSRRPATLARIDAVLREGVDILYIVGHGTTVAGETYLWLERDDGNADRVPGTVLVDLVTSLRRRPLLIVLASCDSAGGAHEVGLAALGPQLARAGVAAVVAIQGSLGQRTAAVMFPALFRRLLRDGRIDLAMAAARAAAMAAGDNDWWRPVLYQRPPDGRLWVASEGQIEPRSPVFRSYLEHLVTTPSDGLAVLAPQLRLVTAAGEHHLPATTVAAGSDSGADLALLLARHRRLLLVGTAGGGKSWLLRRLARRMASDLLRRAPEGEAPLPEPLRGRLPILIDLGDWHDPAADLIEAAQAALARFPHVAQHLDRLLRTGSAVLILDGVNAMPHLQRDEVSGMVVDPRLRAIAALETHGPWNDVICVVSSWTGDLAPTLAWPRAELLPLSRAQIERGVEMIFRSQPGLARRFLAALFPPGRLPEGALYDLATTSAGLRLLLAHFRREGRLPRQTAEMTHALVNRAASDELAAGRVTSDELAELYRRLGRLAINLAIADLVAVDRALAVAWATSDTGRTTETRRFWQLAQAVGQLALEGGQVRFTSQGIRDYFAAHELRHLVTEGTLPAQVASPQLASAWTVARWLDDGLVAQVSAQLAAPAAPTRRVAAAVLALIPDPLAREDLAHALGDLDAEVRHHAARALATLGDARAVPQLLAALRRTETAVRRECALLLGRLKAPLVSRSLASLLASDPVADVRAAAATALGTCGDPSATAPLIAVLLDNHARVRAAAAAALGTIGDTTALGPLIDTLTHDMLPVAGATARALARFGDPALQPLIALLRADTATAARAALALGYLGDPRALPALTDLLDEASEPLAPALHDALRALGDPALSALVSALSAPSKAMRRGAAEALGAIGDQRATPHLIHSLSDADEAVANAATVALVALGPDVAEPLAQLLVRGDPVASRRAALVLGRLGERGMGQLDRAIHHQRAMVRAAGAAGIAQAAATGDAGLRRRAAALLSVALYDVDAGVRSEAVRGLGLLGDERAIPQLITALGARDDEVARMAVESLGQLGDARAVGPLAGALHHRSPVVRAAAARALEELLRGTARSQSEVLTRPLVPLLITLEDPDSAVRMAALGALEALAASPAARTMPHELRNTALPALTSALRHSDAAVRAGASRLAGTVGDERIGPALLKALTDPSAAVRAAAATSLGQLQLPATAEALVAHLDDPSPLARNAARAALVRVPGAARAAIGRLPTAGPQQRWLISQVLAALGPVALPELIAALAGPPQVARVAADALLPRDDLRALAYDLAPEPSEEAWRRAIEALDADMARQLVDLARRPEPTVRAAAVSLLRRISALRLSDSSSTAHHCQAGRG